MHCGKDIALMVSSAYYCSFACQKAHDEETVEPKLCECGCGELAPLSPVNRRSRGWIKGRPMRFIEGHNLRASPASSTEAQQ